MFGIASSPHVDVHRRPPRADPTAVSGRNATHRRCANHRTGGHRNSCARQGAAQRWAASRTALGLGATRRRHRHPPRHLLLRRPGGERSAWIDGDNTVAGAFWSNAGGLYLVRPTSRLHAMRAAEELLRSGGFSLLVLAGTEPQGTEIVRLTRAAREGGAALVTIGTSASMASLRLTSQLLHYSLAAHAVRRSGGGTRRHRSRSRARGWLERTHGLSYSGHAS